MFDFKLDLDAAKSAQKGGKMATGVYPVVIETAFIDKSKAGDPMLSLQIRSEDGEVGFLNNMGINKTWSGGSDNFSYERIMEFIACAGATALSGQECKRKMGEGEVSAICVPELVGRKLRVAVYQKFSVYNAVEKEEIVLQQSFLENGKTLAEQDAGKDAVAIIKTADRLKPFYDKSHEAWVAAGRPGGASTAAPTEAAAPAANQEKLF